MHPVVVYSYPGGIAIDSEKWSNQVYLLNLLTADPLGGKRAECASSAPAHSLDRILPWNSRQTAFSDCLKSRPLAVLNQTD